MNVKFFLILVVIFFFNTSISAYENDEDLAIINDVVKLYESNIFKKFNRELRVQIIEDEIENAYAYYNALLIVFHRGYLIFLENDEVLRSICHELGHLLGDNSQYHFLDSLSAVEGESDYFSGSCMVNYYEKVKKLSRSDAIQRADSLARHQFMKIYNQKISPMMAHFTPTKKGTVLFDHPSSHCRLLTTLHGIYLKPRPHCWYNP
jgi:hypothetical protein